jgi:ubiquinone/menaquinone biosynthesis C-methylase UbiE
MTPDPAASDALRAIYERRAELQYAAPALPDPSLDRKFERLHSELVARLPVDSLLDAGCGDGRYLRALDQQLPERIAGVDLSERILETAHAAIPRAELRQGNLEALPFDDASFDLVLCTQVIEHVLDAAAGIDELVRVLTAGGRVVISTDNERNIVTRVLNAPRTGVVRALRLRGTRGRIESPATPYTRESFRALLEGAGLMVSRLETFRFQLMWPLGGTPAQRLLNRVDAALPAHGVGDIVVAVARKP